ncbi:hypothetical protein TMatcc_007219 [Talaromyces marneffei ATCC 18224]|uniref:uncharacterized protein n=1 Tax=Talaromyces marneffei TaxID=37727 RepID=UPI0012A9D388|nr:uncharacterized protein EYB26_004197 [Talaromyces marneffei]KAE8553343.1 hypothetical protein EYB25_004725 [Talaromyces marneffei]QGA16530.1 hypothetical protein EYB26_004197 [Talaromyces marneffei]
MPERQSLRLKIPSEKLALIQQFMDGVKKKRKTRVNWKAGEKEAMLALREQYPKMPLKDFQETYYPDRTVKTLGALIRQLRKEPGKEEDTETGNEDHCHSNTPRLTRLKRPRRSGPFEYSDSEEEDSSSDEIIEDINPSGHCTPNKFIKLSHSAEAQSPPARRQAVEQRDPRLRSQTNASPQMPKNTTELASRPQTSPPETTTVGQDTGCAEPSTGSTGITPPLLDISLDRPVEHPGAELHVIIQDNQQQQTQLQAPNQELFSEALIRQEFAKEVTSIYAKLQTLCQFEEQLFAAVSQGRAQNSVLEKEYDIMKRDYGTMKKEYDEMKNGKDIEIAQLKESWQAERDALMQKNTRLGKGLEKMQDVLKDLEA